MRKQVFGRRFKRDTNERKALFKGLMSSLVLHGRIVTTEAKAKAIKGQADKLVTLAKKYKNQSRRHVSPYLTESAIETFITRVAPSFENRQGGYTRIIRKGQRLADNAMMAVIEWTEKPQAESIKSIKGTTGIKGKEKKKTRDTRRTQSRAKKAQVKEKTK